MHRELARKLRPLLALPAALPMLMGAEGGCTLFQATLDSPVQAVTTLVEKADGTVEVDLTIVSTAPEDGAVFVSNARNAQLRVPGGAIVDLVPAEPGHYRATSDDNPDLVYDTSQNYRVTFELDDEDLAEDAAGGDFIAVVTAPDEEVSFELTKAPDFAGDTAEVTWTPTNLEGLLRVRNETGEIVYDTFDWSHPEFDGSKWASLIRGGSHTLPVDVFADPGTYTISFCAVASQEGFDEELSSGLGALSGFLAGKCVDDVIVDVAP